jgi:hypothetical protein
MMYRDDSNTSFIGHAQRVSVFWLIRRFLWLGVTRKRSQGEYDYPNGDRGGNENLCAGDVAKPTNGPAQVLGWHNYFQPESHATNKTRAMALRNRHDFQRSQLTELANSDFESWAKESFEMRQDRLL